jgi:hypothetical protein
MRFPLLKATPGAIRYVRRFAFVPVTVGKVRIWFESYYVKQEYGRKVEFCTYSIKMYEVGGYRWETVGKVLPEDPALMQQAVDESPLSKALK